MIRVVGWQLHGAAATAAAADQQQHDEAEEASTPACKTYLARMAGREGEALLIDPGSPGNLVGDAWSERMSALAATAGAQQPQRKDISATVLEDLEQAVRRVRRKFDTSLP